MNGAFPPLAHMFSWRSTGHLGTVVCSNFLRWSKGIRLAFNHVYSEFLVCSERLYTVKRWYARSQVS